MFMLIKVTCSPLSCLFTPNEFQFATNEIQLAQNEIHVPNETHAPNKVQDALNDNIMNIISHYPASPLAE